MNLRGFMILFLAGSAFADEPAPDPYKDYSGRQIMDLVYEKHQQYPYVYEEQSMILVDRDGHKNTRKLRRYSRVDESGSANFLLLFDSPIDVKGVALLAHRDADGQATQSFYLPAFGAAFIESNTATGERSDDNFLGSDYSVENLVGEMLAEHRHVRREDALIDETDYFVVDVFEPQALEEAPPVRRHYIRKDNVYISQTDHFDDLGRLKKRQTSHDLTNVHGDMWRANMMMMDNLQKTHRTIIKINRRVFSSDYVPEAVFTEEWIVSNQPPRDEGANL